MTAILRVISFEWKGDRLGPLLQEAGKQGTLEAAEFLKAQSIPETPLDEGNLRGSYVIKPTAKGADLIVDSVYAKNQHESENFVHEKGGKAHYVSDPLRENTARMHAMIAAKCRRAINGA
jgi:hypothetical protein